MEIKVTKEALYAVLKPGLDELTKKLAEDAIKQLEHSAVVERDGRVQLVRESPIRIANICQRALQKAKPLPFGWRYGEDIEGDGLLRLLAFSDVFTVTVWRWPSEEAHALCGGSAERCGHNDYQSHFYEIGRFELYARRPEPFAIWLHGQIRADLAGDKSELERKEFPK